MIAGHSHSRRECARVCLLAKINVHVRASLMIFNLGKSVWVEKHLAKKLAHFLPSNGPICF
jgi:hypothetical protein